MHRVATPGSTCTLLGLLHGHHPGPAAGCRVQDREPGAEPEAVGAPTGSLRSPGAPRQPTTQPRRPPSATTRQLGRDDGGGWGVAVRRAPSAHEPSNEAARRRHWPRSPPRQPAAGPGPLKPRPSGRPGAVLAVDAPTHRYLLRTAGAAPRSGQARSSDPRVNLYAPRLLHGHHPGPATGCRVRGQLRGPIRGPIRGRLVAGAPTGSLRPPGAPPQRTTQPGRPPSATTRQLGRDDGGGGGSRSTPRSIHSRAIQRSPPGAGPSPGSRQPAPDL
jgi:hypothetical protein